MKHILNRGRHPTFVGRSMVERCAGNGGLLFFRAAGEDRGVALVNARKNVLLVMCVLPDARGIGLGTRMLEYIKPNFVRAVEMAVPWFEARGYEAIGEWKHGRALRTRVMVRRSVRALAGRLSDRIQ